MKITPKKKETTLSVLQEIRDTIATLLSARTVKETKEEIVSETNSAFIINLENKPVPDVSIPANHYLIYFPAVTMKQIRISCDNKKSDGTPLLWSRKGWYEDEKFFTEETCREGWKLVPMNLMGKGLTWVEQEKLLSQGTCRTNAAENLYLIHAIEKQTKKRMWEYEYAWSSSRSSDGGLVGVGGFGAVGLDVCGFDPRGRDDGLGVSFFRSVSVKNEK